MKKEDIKPNVIYKNKETGKLGVLFLGYDYGCLSNREVGMVYKGEDNKPEEFNCYFHGTNPDDLEGYTLKPEDKLTKSHIDDVCKVGQGESCCCYLIMNPKGFSCARVDADTSIAHEIIERVKKERIGAKAINCGGRYNFPQN